MVPSVAERIQTHNLATRPIHHQAVELRLHLTHLRRQTLTQLVVVSQRLRRDALYQLLGLIDELIEFLVRPYIQPTETLEEIHQVRDRRVTEDPPFTIAAVKPLGQMRHQLAKLVDEGLLSELHRFFKASSNAFLLLF